jgi:hypothetical protein
MSNQLQGIISNPAAKFDEQAFYLSAPPHYQEDEPLNNGTDFNLAYSCLCRKRKV